MSAPRRDEKMKCLVFMPMLAGFEEIRASVARGICASGTTMLRLEEVLPDADWQHWLLRMLPEASFVLADMTDHNPFVMYELGLAHARQLPTLLIVDSRNERVPATVLGTTFLPYDLTDLAMFEDELAAAIEVLSTECGLWADPSDEDKEYSILDSRQSYARALGLAEAFVAATSTAIDTVSYDEFATRLAVASARGDRFPAASDDERRKLYLLARAIKNSDDVSLMRLLWQWLPSSTVPLLLTPTPNIDGG